MLKKIDPFTWYSERELTFTPVHFIISSTPLTVESKLWIIHNLQGRYSIVNNKEEDAWIQVMNLYGHPAFEDPKEAILYELTWS